MLKLYPDQEDLVEKARAAFREHRKNCLVLPTGGGKTVIAAYIAKQASKRGLIWFLVHRIELLEQAVETLRGCGLKVTECASGRPGWVPKNTDAVVAMAPTLIKRGPTALPKPHIIIIDEAHHARAKTWETILGWWPEAYRLGLTATPQRLDGQGLGATFDGLVEGPKIADLIEMGRLCPYVLKVPKFLYEGHAFKITAGEYNQKEVAKATTGKVIGNVAEAVSQNCRDRTTLIFSASINASVELVRQLEGQGIKSCHLDGKSPPDFRRRAMQSWAAGRIRVISNVALFSEGLDAPACDSLILARPTASVTTYLQQIGRVLRFKEGKRAEILDLAGNAMTHGLPDMPRLWSLAERRKRTARKSSSAVKICGNCAAALRPWNKVCLYCQHVHIVKGQPMEEKKGDLFELTGAMANQALDLQKAKKANQRYTSGQIFTAARSRQNSYKDIKAMVAAVPSFKSGLAYTAMVRAGRKEECFGRQ